MKWYQRRELVIWYSAASQAVKKRLYMCCSETVIVPVLKSVARKWIV
jgi:hypothetical protein